MTSDLIQPKLKPKRIFFQGVGMGTATSVTAAAFSEEHTERLTGITKSQLRYWDRTGFYKPSFAEDNRRVAFSRIYSFRDIAALRVIHVMRNQFGVPLQHLRVIGERLSHLEEQKWTGTRLWVLNKRVVWQEPATERPQEIASKQYVVPLELGTVVLDTLADVATLKKRPGQKVGQVEKSRYISQNVHVIAGTRIPVAAIQRFDEAGYSIDRIKAEYPDLTDEDVRAALAHKRPRSAA